MTTATQTVMGYRATRSEDRLVVHRVPIFCACERGGKEFDEAWIAAAINKAMQRQREGYMPPLHIRHHEPSTDMTNSVQAAGYFKILGAEPITLQGKRRNAILADLVITDPTVADQVLQMRLPYRSVEIFDIDKPSIDSLALLDHEAPFLELPMLAIREVEDAPAGTVPPATFRSFDFQETESPLVGCFRTGTAAHLLFRQERQGMTTQTETNETKPETQWAQGVPGVAGSVNFEKEDGDGEKKGDDKGEDMEGGDSLDVSAVVKAIGDGSISVADMDAILAAIQAQKTEAAPEEQPAPAAVPGAEAMSKGTEIGERMAVLAGENLALKARMDQKEAEDQRKSDVAAAMKRLDGRPLGSDFEQHLVEFHTESGPKLFAKHVDTIAKTFGTLPSDDGKGQAFLGQSRSVSSVAMKYQEAGSEHVDKAAQFSREWKQLYDTGHVQMSEDRYVEMSMSRLGVTIQKAS